MTTFHVFGHVLVCVSMGVGMGVGVGVGVSVGGCGCGFGCVNGKGGMVKWITFSLIFIRTWY